uniref:HTH CENPB-type domain-containing protein n=1 Tax=Globisporangium ultimum (strain ATCC 200006 / CBS 805.95 / DAOM BR144) TaxID=431595 RepID=K3WI55_GLOUD
MAKKAMAMAMATHRRRMTLDEEARVYAHYVSNPLVSMAALAEWAAALFRLDKVPAESTMVSLVQWYKEHPERSGGGAGDASEHAGGYRIEEEEEEEEEEEIDEREERDGETQDNATTPITSTTTMTAPTTPKRGRKPKGTGAPAGTTIQSAIISKLYATLEPELQEWLVEVETRGESPSVQEIRKKAATIRDRLLKNHPRPKTIQKSMKFTVEWVRKFQEQCYNQKDASQQLSQMAATQLSSFADAALTSAQTAPPRQSAPPSRIIRMIPDAPLVAKKVVPRLPIKPKGRAIPRPTAAEAAATTTTTGIMATSSGKVRGKHMTKEQKDRIYEQYQADPMMSLQELANWAAAEFQLSKTPSVSTVSNVLKQHQERPDQRHECYIRCYCYYSVYDGNDGGLYW